MPKIVFNKQNFDALARALGGGQKEIIPQATAHPGGGGGEGVRPQHVGGGGQSHSGLPKPSAAAPPDLQNMRLQQQVQAHVQQAQELAKINESTFEKRYTFKDKQQIAKLRQAQSDLQKNPNFDDDQKVAVNRAIEMKISGILPKDLPKLQPFSKGKGIGDEWVEDGVQKTRNAEGTVVRLATPDKTLSGMREKQKVDHENKIMDTRFKLAAENINHGLKGEDGNPLEPKYHSIEDINKMMDNAHGLRRLPPAVSTEQLQQMALNKHQDILQQAINDPNKLNERRLKPCLTYSNGWMNLGRRRLLRFMTPRPE